MTIKPRCSIKRYILLGVFSTTVGMIIGAILLSMLASVMGFGIQAVLVIVLLSLPVCLFSTLYGFYKGLVRYYGFKGDEKLFFGGKF